MSENTLQFTDAQKEALLRDSNKNNIPDFIEQGVLPEEMGMELGGKMDERNRTIRKGNIKLLSKFVRVDTLRAELEKGGHQSYEELLQKAAQSRIKKWLPYIIVIDLVVIVSIVYFVLR